jgi:hypothetical protein
VAPAMTSNVVTTVMAVHAPTQQVAGLPVWLDYVAAGGRSNSYASTAAATTALTMCCRIYD